MYNKELGRIQDRMRQPDRDSVGEAQQPPPRRLRPHEQDEMALRLHDAFQEQLREHRGQLEAKYLPPPQTGPKLTQEQVTEMADRLHYQDVKYRWAKQQELIERVEREKNDVDNAQRPKCLTVDEAAELTDRLVKQALSAREQKLTDLKKRCLPEQTTVKLTSQEQYESTKRLYDERVQQSKEHHKELSKKYVHELSPRYRTDDPVAQPRKCEALFQGKSTVHADFA
eukprot:NODE_668_length_1279_cov_3.742188_g629_i0.p1 GENE.NODE_668_length_1279_cov_3.742188_g629_i0~~NODE_668_length_1279_cov_3.742188_g629_i0.p1  ORF type:complete len:227 (-),score=42.13 NODE_668_length_1279_cov_3.742188_g629_i0:11-691(-)